ncbi:LPP20 family lipoprotein [Helicobacter mastomyrinus]|uniref:LPP20 family lipoprotein n=1 Tax=Helicobacter mastomyrinus TaxID=287948 RepID=A0ABZ3F4W5_9HELI|nr:LPP20 family lipoprotein [uncultured Helicobacter sp.]
MLSLRFVCLIAFICIYGGCWASPSKPPLWYGKSTISDQSLIGFGNDKNLDSAKAKALSDIVTQLNVQVSSQFTSTTQRQDFQTSHNASSDVYLDSANINLNDVHYTKSAFENGQFYIQAEITKNALIAQFQKEFDVAYNKLNPANLKKCRILSIKDKTRLAKILNTLHLYADLLQTLGKSSKSLSSFESILNANTPLPLAQLLIETNMPNDKISNDLAKELGYFYRIQNNAAHTLKAKIQISNTSSENAKINILFSILDCSGNPIFNTNVSYEAIDTKDALYVASQRVSIQLYKKIQEWIEE